MSDDRKAAWQQTTLHHSKRITRSMWNEIKGSDLHAQMTVQQIIVAVGWVGDRAHRDKALGILRDDIVDHALSLPGFFMLADYTTWPSGLIVHFSEAAAYEDMKIWLKLACPQEDHRLALL